MAHATVRQRPSLEAVFLLPCCLSSLCSSQESGGVCLPLRRLPLELTLQEVIKTSSDPEAKLTTYDPKTRSKWIQLVGSNPHLLYEERKQEPFDLMEELFEEFSWVPEKYVQMGPDSFMSRYCW